MPNKLKTLGQSYVPHYSTPEYCLCSNDHFIYKYTYQTQKFTQIGKLAAKNNTLKGKVIDLIARSKLYRWYRPSFGLSHIYPLASGTIVIIYDKLYRLEQHESIAKATFNLDSINAKAPLKGGLAANAKKDCLFFGEYINDRSRPIRIFRIYNDGKDIEVCHTFEQDEIKHVHSITWDPYRERLWVTTGDNDDECAFYYTDDEFNTLHRYKGGDQTWRAVSLIPTPDGLIWGTDAGKDAPASAENHIYHLNLSTGVRTTLQSTGNPCYESAITQDGKFIIGSTYEPGQKQNTPQEAAIWLSEDAKSFQKIYSVDYQANSLQGCTKYAHSFLPKGVIPSEFIPMMLVNTTQHHSKLSLLNIKANSS